MAAFLGVGILAYLAGAATMFFQLPSSDLLNKAFRGSQDWVAQAHAEHGTPGGDLTQAKVVVDRPTATYDGFTLITANQAPSAMLLDMHGRKVHEWTMAERRPWPAANGVGDPLPSDGVHWEKCLVLPDGDVVALCCTSGGPYGYGVARFDKQSRLRWGYAANVHHDCDVGEDGRVYVLTQQANVPPPTGQDWITEPYTADYVVVLDADGKERKRIAVLEAFLASPYALTAVPDPEAVASGTPGAPPVPGRRPPPQPGNDVLHTNSVRCLDKSAAGGPLFKPGQLLLSLRTPNVIAVLDPDTERIVWAARGPWQGQHDARLLPNGRVLLFDNLGAPRGARVLEYDPVTQAVPWAYAGDKATPLTTAFRGGVQRLPNGNTLVVDAAELLVVEVTPAREVVWRWSCPAPPPPAAGKDSSLLLNLTSARRYGPEELPFLAAVAKARNR